MQQIQVPRLQGDEAFPMIEAFWVVAISFLPWRRRGVVWLASSGVLASLRRWRRLHSYLPVILSAEILSQRYVFFTRSQRLGYSRVERVQDQDLWPLARASFFAIGLTSGACARSLVGIRVPRNVESTLSVAQVDTALRCPKGSGA